MSLKQRKRPLQTVRTTCSVKMPKKAKKRKHKKSSSSSSEEDERISRGQYASNSYKTAKRKEVLKSQKSCKKDKEKSVSSSVKDDSQSTRQIKKPVYRLAKTQATEQKPINKDRQYAKSKPDFVAFHGDHCSSKAKNYVSGKDKTVTGSDIVERGYSKLSAGAVPQRTETKSKGGFDEKSSQRSQSKLNKPRVGPSLVSAEVKEPRQDVQKRNCRTEDPPRTGNHSRYIKTSKPTSSTSAIEMCQKHEKKELKPQRSFYKDDANTSSASILKKSSTSAKHSASESSSKIQVVEELHLARSEKRLEVNVLKSYGELTAMDIDCPEEGPAGRNSSQQDLILVLDTNILLSHLDYVKKIRCHGLGGLGFPIIVIPWVVLQEMDSLKMGRGLSGSVAHLATPAISYIYKCLKSREPRLWGQSMQQAAESSNGLTAENNDDRVLQCCLQYQRLYPECALTLCTNDKNLCSKALLSGVKALCKTDLEAEVGRSRHGLQITGGIQASVPPSNNPQVLSPTLSTRCPPVQPHGQKKAGFYVGVLHKESKQLSEGDEERTLRDLSGCISALEDCLREVLSDVLQVEMKAAYDDLWLEIVYLKPPWTLQDVLQCIKKHWIAVFGHLTHRRKEQTVLKLIKFFNSGETVEREAISEVVQDAKELVNAFSRSSKRVPRAVAVLDDILNKLRPQPNPPTGGESPACDVVMNDDDDNGDSHQEVWAVFERIWSHVCQLSLEVFKALGFDPHTRQCLQPEGAAPPPQDALACLHKLSSMVSQLLQAFSSVLLSAPGLEEVQTLLSIINSNNIVTENSRLTAKSLLDCFSQPDYREKLRVGGTKLMELQEALEHCVQAAGQYTTFPT
ncbi:transcriptional protein SWT1 isoform X1 [Astatotilapia calliptera]|nr:transcriptional protein SWT1 isoform X1 [Maylandia zebra]XP_026001842.1 transcriptional protein SWT1 isoform X1 [Astatotilapia calliptera]